LISVVKESGLGIVVAQRCNAERHLCVGIAGIQRHGPAQQLACLAELHAVAVDHAEVVEALDVIGLQLQAGAQQRDRLVVTASPEVIVDGGAGGELIGLGLPGHLDLAAGKGHVHAAASLAVSVLEVGGDRLAEGLTATLPRRLWQQAHI